MFQKIIQVLRSKPKHWLVTGGAGFIGSHLVESLLRWGQKVTAWDDLSTGKIDNIQAALKPNKENFQWIQGSILDRGLCQKVFQTHVDIVLHQAALPSVPQSIQEPMLTHEVNVRGFLNILEAARQSGVERMVYASSSAVYGDDPLAAKKESHLGKILSPYGAHKRMNELYAQTWQKVYGFAAVGLRYFNIFGPRQDPHGAYAAVIPQWILRILEGKSCIVYGDGLNQRDFCHVSDVVQANVLAALHPDLQGGELFNIGTGQSIDLLTLHQKIVKAVQKLKPQYLIQPLIFEAFRPGDIRFSMANIEHAMQVLEYQPRTSIDDGLLETVKFFMQTVEQ